MHDFGEFSQKQMKYIGEETALQGKTALVRPVDGDNYEFDVLVQFDELELMHNDIALGLGWHVFHFTDFAEIENPAQ